MGLVAAGNDANQFDVAKLNKAWPAICKARQIHPLGVDVVVFSILFCHGS